AHLLAALLEQADGVVLPLLQKLGVTPTTLRNRVTEQLSTMSSAYGASGETRLAPSLVRVLEAAHREAVQLGDSYVSTEHLLLALVDAGENTSKLLAEQGVTRDAVLDGLRQVRGAQRV